MILPDWFYAAVLDNALVLTIDPAYFSLSGGLERWLYRIVRKHGGRQAEGWQFDIAHLHAKSGSLSPLKHFAYDLRDIVRRQPLPGYRLVIERLRHGGERFSFTPIPSAFAAMRLDPRSRSNLGISCKSARAIGDRSLSCHQGPDPRAIRDQNPQKTKEFCGSPGALT